MEIERQKLDLGDSWGAMCRLRSQQPKLMFSSERPLTLFSALNFAGTIICRASGPHSIFDTLPGTTNSQPPSCVCAWCATTKMPEQI
jgi:hypothetical protein